MPETINQNNSVVLQIPDAELDMYNVPDLKDAIKDRLQAKPHTVVLDLQKVELMDSSAIGMLFSLQQHIKTYAGNLILVNLKGHVLKALKGIQALELFTIYDGVAEALEAAQNAAA